jgi:tRNA threonylcarbamoyladenosine biosynthesis protein TsaB
VALQSLTAEPEVPLLAAFPLGRGLSNQLLTCIETVLPAADWTRLGRLAVATGPGGFTGTRLTIVVARTLAQQLASPSTASAASG